MMSFQRVASRYDLQGCVPGRHEKLCARPAHLQVQGGRGLEPPQQHRRGMAHSREGSGGEAVCP